MGLPAPALGYDGVVIVGMSKVEVKDGELRLQGRHLYVDEQGLVYQGDGDKPIARVVNGRLAGMQ
jgi:hypothetical protein